MNNVFSRRLMACALVLLLVLGIPVTALAAEQVALVEPDEFGNVPFQVENMFPGDQETLDFNVQVKHKKPITLYYHADIQPGYELLAEVLMVKIELPEKNVVLYDGLMRDMPAALEHALAADETQLLYRITAYLDTSVGNAYMYQSLLADFRWWYEVEEEEKPPVVDPETGDNAPIGLYVTLVVLSLAGIVVLLIFLRRGKKEGGEK